MPRRTNKKETRRAPREQQPSSRASEPWTLERRAAEGRPALEPRFAATSYEPHCRSCGTVEGLTTVYRCTSKGFMPTSAICGTCGPVRQRPAPSWVQARPEQAGQ